MNLKNRIQNCLNNENGGPNLENLIAVGTSIICFIALWALREALYAEITRIFTKAANY